MSTTSNPPTQRSRQRHLRVQCALFLIFLAIYASGFNVRVDVGDSTHYALIRSMGDYGRFNLGEYAGYTFKIDVSYRDGKWYSDKAPGVCFLSLPFYMAGKAVARALGREDQEIPLSFVLLVPALAGATTVALLFRLCLALRASSADAAHALTGLSAALRPYLRIFSMRVVRLILRASAARV